MRMIILSSLFAVGVALTGVSAASAAPAAAGLSTAASTASLLEESAVRCRMQRTCFRGPYGGRRCEVRRVCRRW
jgi:hypothetical protein